MAVLDLVQWPNERPDELVHREPQSGSGEFKLGSQLVVREAQSAIFARDGKALDVFGPGRYTLSTKNLPFLTGLIGLPFGGDSPFTAEAYFVTRREIPGLKWGTPSPMTFRDKDLGAVRLGAFGTYSMRVADPALFVTTVVGPRGVYTISDIDDFLRSLIVQEFNDSLGSSESSLYDLAGMTNELSSTVRASVSDEFAKLGLELTSLQINAITPPEEVLKRIDERSGMAAIGDMGTYTQYQAAQAMRDAAQNPSGGVAGTGVGLGAGVALGQAMAGALTSAQQQSAGSKAAISTIACPFCSTVIPADSKFCPSCGKGLQLTCAKCGQPIPAGAKFCPNCGAEVASG